MASKEPDKISVDTVAEELKQQLDLIVQSNGKILLSQAKNSSEGDASIYVTPRNPRAARIEITLDPDFGAYLTIGEGAIFEVPFAGKRYTAFDFAKEVIALCAAVIRAGFEEEVFRAKGKVVGAIGTIRPTGELSKQTSETWMKVGMDIFRKKETQRHVYEPYA